MKRFSLSRRSVVLAALLVLLAMAGLPQFASAQSDVAPAPVTLTAEQEAGLIFMREEEKLAQDVYLALGELWGLPIFGRIANAEAQHQSAVLRVMDRYGLEDPAAGLDAGQFADADLQTLYDTLVAQGSESLEAALAVGALVEETDIADLDVELAGALPADVANVYSHLRAGSTNHLRAFTRLLASQTGTEYVPQVLDEETYTAITAADGRGAAAGRRGRR